MHVRNFLPAAYALQSPLSGGSHNHLYRSCRRHATTYAAPTEVAIIGGGITGLATAMFLCWWVKDVKITIFEASSEMGGWMKSKKVPVRGGDVLFELGPRSLRPSLPASIGMIDLINGLDMYKDIIVCGKDTPAARNRFIYYPDHLVRLPGPGTSVMEMARTLLSEPLMEGLGSGLWKDFTQTEAQPKVKVNGLSTWMEYPDESIASFISRRMDPRIADNIVSAVCHGIYAGDINKLSFRGLFPNVAHTYDTHGSLIRGAIDNFTLSVRGHRKLEHSDCMEMIMIRKESQRWATKNPQLGSWWRSWRKSSIYSFHEGLEYLPRRLIKELSKWKSVTFKQEVSVQSLELPSGVQPKIQIRYKDPKSRQPVSSKMFSHVVSTVSGKALSKIARPSNHPEDLLAPLAYNPSVDVMVVNVFYKNPSLLPVNGFGYLIPNSTSIAEQNPELALGIVFDSEAFKEQDSVNGTKLTVMLGGHWWSGDSHRPSKQEGEQLAKSVLKRHLGITEEPDAMLVSLSRDCIPQYLVGHNDRMRKAHFILKEKFKGRLAVAGSSYRGVGVNDCIRSAWEVAQGLGSHAELTGLQGFVTDNWLTVKKTDVDPEYVG